MFLPFKDFLVIFFFYFKKSKNFPRQVKVDGERNGEWFGKLYIIKVDIYFVVCFYSFFPKLHSKHFLLFLPKKRNRGRHERWFGGESGMEINHFHVQFNVLEVKSSCARQTQMSTSALRCQCGSSSLSSYHINGSFFGSNFIMELKIISR